MMLIEETPIPDTGLPIEAFKAHLRMSSGFGPDDVQGAVLASFLRAAIAAVEARTGKALFVRKFMLTVSEWQTLDTQVLPIGPVTSILLIETVARDGTRTEANAANYWLQQDMQRPRVKAAGTLPRIPTGGEGFVAFHAGFALTWDTLPADLRQAVMMLAAHYYEYRNDTGLSDGCMPFGVSSLLERYKMVRLGAGVTT